MQRVQPFEHHSDAYLSTAALKSRAFGVISCKECFLFGCEGAGFVLRCFKIKTTGADKLLSRYSAALISKCPPKRLRRSIQYIKVVVKYCRVDNKAHNN